jgi:hypothetical protein
MVELLLALNKWDGCKKTVRLERRQVIAGIRPPFPSPSPMTLQCCMPNVMLPTENKDWLDILHVNELAFVLQFS